MYEVKDFSFSFEQSKKKIFNNLSFEIQKGEKIVILGESGCGKSTLIRILAGLIPSSLSLPSLNLGFVFQEANLIPWKTALENTLLGHEIQHTLNKEIQTEAQNLLTTIGLGESLQKYPEELSGGMKMRVSFARAILSKPSVLIMDEPFSALDELTRFDLQNLLLGFHQKNPSTTLLFVTHSMSEASFLADRIFIIRNQKIESIQDIQYSIPRTDQLRSHPEYIQNVEKLTSIMKLGKKV